jgi:tetratricopeptide (TPR) repeat protein
MNINKNIAYLFSILWIVSACQFYHDTTAHFNAHFLADERMKEIEDKIFTSYKDNFNEILQVLPPLDTNANAAYKADFEYCIKKASLPIQFHSQSKWTDDCYIIVGKARMYQGDFSNALTTLKYVNTESNDDNARHQALILLMRIFIAENDKKSVLFTANYLAKEQKVSDENAKDFYTIMAHYYRLQNNLPKTVEYLEKALPYTDNRRMKTKFYFIAAQIQQQLGNDAKAYEYYNEVLKRNPTYEMTFNAQINSSRSLSMDNPDAVAKGEKYLKNLLTDEKNKEYLDKIYYELGSFEARRNNAQRAVEYLKESLIANTSGDSGQKIASYLRLGQVYYELKKDYPKSVNYYDSAMNLMNESSSNYAKIKKQLEVLKSFAQFYTVVSESDRLLTLAGMNDSERDAFLEKEMQVERAELEQERLFYLSSKQKIANTQATANVTPSLTANNPNEKKWYFYNPVVKESGELNFYRVWGNRPLEDNWRRSQKSSIPVANNQVENSTAQDNNANNGSDNQAVATTEKINGIEIKSKKDRLAQIPNTPEALDKTKENLQKGLFELGKMYYLLKENVKAQETLMRIVKEFPQSTLAPEAIFTLSKICKDIKDCDASQYEKMLRESYPNSSFAKSLDNKDFFKEVKVQDSTVNRLYEEAYILYQTEQYSQSLSKLENIDSQYPNSHLADKIKLLKIMLKVKTTTDLGEIETSLQTFIEENKGNELEPLAQSLLENIKKKRKGSE